MSDLVITVQREAIFEIVLNRPGKRNAINLEMYRALEDAVQQAAKSTQARAVLVRGAGKVFSAGIDVTTFMLLSQEYGDNWPQRMRSITDSFQRVLTQLERLELPTIALIQGHCLGLALELALACDIRIAAGDAVLGLPETRLGMIPDVGGTTRLTRLIGPARAKELILTGREIDADWAERWGMVNRTVAPEELSAAGEALAEELSRAAPLAVGMAKRVIDGLADLERGMLLEGWAQSQLFQTADFKEAIESFMMRREPRFTGR